MSVTHTIPFAAERAENGTVRNIVNYLGFLVSTYAVARAWSSHQAADPRDLHRSGMASLEKQVLALRY